MLFSVFKTEKVLRGAASKSFVVMGDQGEDEDNFGFKFQISYIIMVRS
jgi:hypothetical protein